MKPKHTPGEWYAVKYPDAKTWTVAAKESVASKIKTADDAALIASAPELKDALQSALSFAYMHTEQDNLPSWVKKAEAAIALAEGRAE